MVPVILTLLIITAFGENWHLIPIKYTKYFLTIDLIIYLIIAGIQTQFEEDLSVKSVLLFVGCTAIAMILLKLQHRFYIKKQIERES